MTFPQNTHRIEDLPSLALQDIAFLPIDMLAVLQRDIDERLKRDKVIKACLDSALEVRFASRAAEARKSCGKDTGTVRLVEGDYTVIADLPKRVDWDQDKLAAMVERIRAAGENPADYVDIAYKVPERNYTAWPDPIRQGFEPARTVKAGALKVTIEPSEASK